MHVSVFLYVYHNVGLLSNCEHLEILQPSKVTENHTSAKKGTNHTNMGHCKCLCEFLMSFVVFEIFL